MRLVDLAGQRFDRLTVLVRSGTIGKAASWSCSCDCGETTIVSGDLLRDGRTRSCGCLKAETYYQIDLKRVPVVDGDVVRIPLTRGMFALVDLEDAEVGKWNWYALKGRYTWYGCRHADDGPVLLHRVVAGRAGLAIGGLEVATTVMATG